MWRYVKQINHFYRIEEPKEGNDARGKPLKPHVICMVHTEAEAKLICTAVNNSGLKLAMFEKAKVA